MYIFVKEVYGDELSITYLDYRLVKTILRRKGSDR